MALHKKRTKKILMGRLGMPHDMVVDASHYVAMYENNPNSVLGARMIIPKLGDKSLLPKFRIPANNAYSIIDDLLYEPVE